MTLGLYIIPTVAKNMHESTFPASSVAVHVTCVGVATGKVIPDAGVHTMSSCISTSSTALGVVHVTGLEGTVTSIGQVISGFPLSVEIKTKKIRHIVRYPICFSQLLIFFFIFTL